MHIAQRMAVNTRVNAPGMRLEVPCVPRDRDSRDRVCSTVCCTDGTGARGRQGLVV